MARNSPKWGARRYAPAAAFRAAVETVDAVLRAPLGWSVAEQIAGGVDADRVARTDIAQPLLFAIQVGIVEALREAGVTACGYLGHSVGEIAAAWAAGALSLADAGRVVIARSRSQQRTQGAGRMAALALDGDAARGFLAELGSTAEIAAFNAAHSVTLSGSVEEIARLGSEARSRNLWFRPLGSRFRLPFRIDGPDPRRIAGEPRRPRVTAAGGAAGIERHRRRRRSRSARRRSLVAQHPKSGALCRGRRRIDRRGLSHFCRNRPERDPAFLSERRAARGRRRGPGRRQPLAQ